MRAFARFPFVTRSPPILEITDRRLPPGRTDREVKRSMWGWVLLAIVVTALLLYFGYIHL